MRNYFKEHWSEAVSIAIIIAFIFIVCTAKCQTIGLNGAGYFENTTELSEQWIAEAVTDKDFVLRFPGGAIAKFADPLNGNGWGMNYEIVDSILAKYGSDEEEDQNGALEKWHRKADEQPDISYLDEIIRLQKNYPKLKIIYTANIYIPTERAIYPINYLLENGVNIVGVEMGNESYSQVNYDFNLYSKKIAALATELRFKKIQVYHPCPATGNRNSSSHQRWVDNLQSVDSRDGIVFHPYYDTREFPALMQPVDTAAAYTQIAAFDFFKQFKEAKALFPNLQKFIVTETNTQPSALIGDTPLNAFFVQRLFEAGGKEFEYFCLHNGVSPDKYGIIYGTSKKGQKKNTSYYPFKDAVQNAVQDTTGGNDTIPPIGNDTIIENCRDTSVISGYTTSITQQVDYDTTCIKRFLRKKICFVYVAGIKYDTVFTPVYSSQIICDTTIFIHSDTIPDTDTTVVGEIQELNADTLFFHNEIEFRDFLKYYNLAHYEVMPTQPNNCDCSQKFPITHYNPTKPEGEKAYLNEDWFVGYCNQNLKDHPEANKMQEVVIPSTGVQMNNLCTINEAYTNPFTGQVALFFDTYNWSDRNGLLLFNCNLKVWLLWNLPQQVIDIPIDVYDVETKTKLMYGHDTWRASLIGMQEEYGYLR